MATPRKPSTQAVAVFLTGVSAAVLVFGVLRSVTTGDSPLWMIGVAIVLAASLMLLTVSRRRR